MPRVDGDIVLTADLNIDDAIENSKSLTETVQNIFKNANIIC